MLLTIAEMPGHSHDALASGRDDLNFSGGNMYGAERILKTPIPFAYAQHIKSFLMLFCFTAPFAMVEQMRWYTPIASAVLAHRLVLVPDAESDPKAREPWRHLSVVEPVASATIAGHGGAGYRLAIDAAAERRPRAITNAGCSSTAGIAAAESCAR